MATASALPYSGLLKRRPVQARSAARVEAILEASAGLLAEGGLDALTMRAVADRARVPTGTIYQFFADRETLIQALAARYVADTPAVLDAVLAEGGGVAATIDMLVDRYAAMLKGAPAMRVLWLAGAMDAATTRLASDADDLIATRLGTHLEAAAGAGTPRPDRSDWRFLVTLVGDLLRRSFASDADGDAVLLSRTKRVAALYATDLLERRAAR